LASLHARLREKLDHPPPTHFLLIEPDEDLRKMIAAEIQQAADFPVKSGGLEACGSPAVLRDAIEVVLQSKATLVAEALPPDSELLALQTRSVPESLAGWLPAPQNALITVASRWPGFRSWVAPCCWPVAFIATRWCFATPKKNWQRGLQEMAAVVCDCVTAADLRNPPRVVVFIFTLRIFHPRASGIPEIPWPSPTAALSTHDSWSRAECYDL
jgi:GntR family transcriptional regulator